MSRIKVENIRHPDGTGDNISLTDTGRVGLGTSSPQQALHLNSSAATTLLQFSDSGSGGTAAQCRIGCVGNDFVVLNNTASNPATTRLKITSGGNVGIGTTSPAKPLETAGFARFTNASASNSAILDIEPDATGSNGVKINTTYYGSGGYGPLKLFTGGGERARIDTSGRLLVGTSSDFSGSTNGLLQATSGGGAELALGRTSTSALGAGSGLARIKFYSNSGSVYEPSAAIDCQTDATQGSGDKPGRLVFSTTADGASSPTERMTITSAGFVCPDASSTDNQGNYNSSTVGGFRWVAGSSNTTVRAESYGNSTSGRYHQAFSNPNGVVGSISTSGSATAYNTSSDYRLKENVVSLTGAVDRVKQLKPSQFNFIADPDQTVDGFLAHEAQAVVPECVTGTKDEVDDEGNPVYQGIDQSKLVPLLTAALQEALDKIETLETQNASFEARLTALEGGQP